MLQRCDGTVYLVEDDDSVRDALARLLTEMGCTVVAFPSSEAFLTGPREAVPACLLLDVRLPGMSGLALQDKLKSGDLPIVFLSGHGDVPMAVDAVKKGAFEFLTKPVDEGDLLRAVHGALEHHRGRLTGVEAAVEARRLVADLTPREMQVLEQVIAGAPNKAIAARLEISIKTVKIHRGNMNAKLGTQSVVAVVNLARLAGIQPDTGSLPID